MALRRRRGENQAAAGVAENQWRKLKYQRNGLLGNIGIDNDIEMTSSEISIVAMGGVMWQS
jgi:hypothetical protein